MITAAPSNHHGSASPRLDQTSFQSRFLKNSQNMNAASAIRTMNLMYFFKVRGVTACTSLANSQKRYSIRRANAKDAAMSKKRRAPTCPAFHGCKSDLVLVLFRRE